MNEVEREIKKLAEENDAPIEIARRYWYLEKKELIRRRDWWGKCLIKGNSLS